MFYSLEASLSNHPEQNTYIVDAVAPVPTISIASDNVNPTIATTGDTVTVTLKFNENVTHNPNWSLSNLQASATAGPGDNRTMAKSAYSQNSTSPTTITFSTKISSDWTSGPFQFVSQNTFYDAAGNPAAPPGGGWAHTQGSNVQVDVDPPMVSAFTPLTSGGPDATEFSWKVEFTEPIGGLDANDFEVGGFDGNPTVTVTPFNTQGSAPQLHQWLQELWGVLPARAGPRLHTQYIVTVTGGTRSLNSDGATLQLTANPTIFDVFGIELTETNPVVPVPPPIPFADVVVPTVVITRDTKSVRKSTLETFTATFTFSEDVEPTGNLLAAINAAMTNAVASDFKVVTHASVFSVLITPDGNGDITLGLAAGSAEDGGGNLNTAAAPVIVPLVDDEGPSVTLENVPDSTDGKSPFTIEVRFSELVAGFDLEFLSVTGATASELTRTGDGTYTVLITPTGGDIKLSVQAEATFGRSGNKSSASPEYTIVEDKDAPRVTSITRETNPTTNDDELVWTISFSEPVGGFDKDDLEITGVQGEIEVKVEAKTDQASVSPWHFLNSVLGVQSAHANSALAQSYTVTVSGGNIADGNVTVTLALATNSSVFDGSGNTLGNPVPTGSNEGAIVVVNDTISPTVVITAPSEVRGPFTATFTFSEPVTGFAANDVALSNATMTEPVASEEIGGFASLFTATVSPLQHGLVSIGVNGGAVSDAAGNRSLASDTVMVTYIDEAYVETRTKAVINNFLNRRAQNILANEPDLSGRLMERGGIGATEPFAFRAEGTTGQLSVDFGGSLTRQRLTSLHPLGYGANVAATPGEGGLQRYNLWVKGSLSKFESDGVVQDFGIIHLGADYRVNEAFIVGAMVQFDWADEADPVASTATSGHGWMIGPYAVVRLHDNLIFDGRIAWGQSDNEVSPFGTYTDEFETDRFLVRGQFTGDFDVNGWSVAPQLSLTYISEQQYAYTDSNNITISEQTVELGQLAFGPKVSRLFEMANGVRINPSVGIKGIWDFKDTGILDIETGAVSNGNGEDLRARLDLGFDIDFANGANLGFAAYYDGIGDNDSEGYGGSAKARIPF
ncbi:MAG: Ig-like domain-containing protein [Ahrensia sp.]